MAYELYEFKIENLINKAIEQEEDIKKGIKDLGYPSKTIAHDLLTQKDQLIKSASPSIHDNYSKMEFEVQRTLPYRFQRDNPFWYVPLSCLLIMAIIYFIYYFSILIDPLKTWLSISIGYLELAILLITTIISGFIINDQLRKHNEKILYRHVYEDTLENEILNNGIKPTIRSYINEKQLESLETILRTKSAPGLWAIMDSSYEVPTNTKKKVERMFGNLAGGSIGIAGPRGVGKSTLLSSICRPDQRTFQNQLVLTVMTSVPVKYEAKDFILHLFSQICEKVIKSERETYNSPSNTPQNLARYRATSGFRSLVSSYFPFIFLLISLGAIGIIFSFFWVTLSGFFPYTFEILSKLMQPGEVFRISSVLFVIPLLLFFCSATSSSQPNYQSLKPQSIERVGRDYTSFIIREAEACLENIHYQLGYSAGWSGGVKLPESIQFIESSADYSFSRTRNPLTLPEIVNSYRNFLINVSKKYKILIGIDELDKISSSQAAQQFLNETKSIFSVHGCFYLVSVSDNAMSNFERRGIAFRDEFDTSFDDVFFLESPNIEYSLELLRRRIIGFPLPFAYYCYVLSGGLPRDLIRISRDVFDISQGFENPVTIADIAKSNVLTDLQSKIRAITIAVTDNLVKPETCFLLESISLINKTCSDYKNWIDIYHILSTNKRITNPNDSADQKLIEKMANLIDELAAYLLFSSTVLQFFIEMGNQPTIQPLTSNEITWLERLARAKQLIPSSPQFSVNVILEFRTEHCLLMQPSIQTIT